jgi:hypothetical protein
VDDPLVSVNFSPRIHVSSCYKFLNGGILHRKVEKVVGLTYGEGIYYSFHGNFSLNFEFLFILCLVILLSLCILEFSFIGEHRGGKFGSIFFCFFFKSQSECRVLGGSFSIILGRDIFYGPTIYFLAWIENISLMENKDILVFMRIMRRHEEIIHSNRTLLFSMTTKLHENVHHCVSQHENIFILLFHQN